MKLLTSKVEILNMKFVHVTIMLINDLLIAVQFLFGDNIYFYCHFRNVPQIECDRFKI